MDPIEPPEPPPGLPELAHPAAVLTGLTRNEALPEELAVRLLPHDLAPLRLALREGFAPSPALCEEYLAHGESQALAHNAALPPEIATRLAADPDPEVRAVRAKLESAGAGRHALFAADTEAQVRIALAGRPDLSAESLAALATDTDAGVRAALARRPELPEDLLRRLLTDTEPEVRARACGHGAPPDLHAVLLADPATRKEVVRSLELDPDTASALAADPVPYAASPHTGLRRAAARSERLPAELLRGMLEDEDPTVRMIALERTPDVDPATAEDIERRHGRSKFLDRPADYFPFAPETLRRFAADPAPRMRLLALRDPDVPAALLERLAADEDHTVRRAVAEDSRTATGTLLRLLGDGSESVAMSAAASPGLPVEAMRAVLDLAARDAAGRGPA
ncbi:hypothetical protein OG898_01685 [Streptomyces sp. NBC_00193]|uniref:hypothetical protein n=1 Tax=Streptomyces sp. NBC_00193 TaxID=2975675 RepID=UPI00224E2CBA|nr:hypothetical protein [Streptomyces sp. NBC_00193]MCX5295205.1 hypothetical protein [Streptomyces sp. NBC_00193]